MSDTLVSYDHVGPAALLTLERADKRNALSRALIAALHQAFEKAQADSAARCVLLAAAGPVFCAGMDLAELQESVESAGGGDPPAGVVWDDALRLARLYDFIYSLPKPTIALVHGPAVAGGAGLVTVCDLAVATPEAKFGYPEVRRGLVAAMVMPHLLRHVGERTARWLLLTGELIDTEAAQRAGLVNAVVAPHQLVATGSEWAGFLAQGGPEALARTKAFLQQFSGQAVSMEEAAQGSAAPRLSDECQQGLRAFFAKQPPPWA